MKWGWETITILHQVKKRLITFHDDDITIGKLSNKRSSAFKYTVQVVTAYIHFYICKVILFF
jgi:hypothetical protein